jgi:hypothetical protein
MAKNKKIKNISKMAFAQDLMFLDYHPAFCGVNFLRHMKLFPSFCCRNDCLEPVEGKISISSKDPKFDTLEPKIPEEDKHRIKEGEKPFYIKVPYKDYFGRDWEPYKFLLISTFGPFMWNDDKRDFIDLEEFDVRGYDVEEVVKKSAAVVKDRFGEFHYMDLQPEWIDEQNKDKEPVLFYPSVDPNDPNDKMELNPEFITFTPRDANNLWWDWMKKEKKDIYAKYNVPGNKPIDNSKWESPEKYFGKPEKKKKEKKDNTIIIENFDINGDNNGKKG